MRRSEKSLLDYAVESPLVIAIGLLSALVFYFLFDALVPQPVEPLEGNTVPLSHARLLFGAAAASVVGGVVTGLLQRPASKARETIQPFVAWVLGVATLAFASAGATYDPGEQMVARLLW